MARTAIAFAEPQVARHPVLVNGVAGVLGTLNGRAVGVMGLTIVGGKIVEIDCLVDPERLTPLDLERLIGTEV